jgi:heme-degrading monooxygenase HmoA
MFAVIFEVQPERERWDEYLALAKRLKPALETIDGFIDNERFASQRTEGRVLSLSTWRDEKAVVRWRTHAMHHAVQEQGRAAVFADYHLRVGEVTADTHVPQGASLAQQRLDATATGAATALTISELAPDADGKPVSADLAADLGLPTDAPGVVDHESFASITIPGKRLLLVGWRASGAAQAWTPRIAPGLGLRHRRVRVVRDYGLLDRREAPQYYPEVARPETTDRPAGASSATGASSD